MLVGVNICNRFLNATSEGGIKSVLDRRACMNIVMKVQQVKEMCKDREIILSAYPKRGPGVKMWIDTILK